MEMTMGQIIRKLRKERNLTQEELAEQLNITPQAISRWESETGMPDISQVVPLANVFGVSVDVLFGTDGVNGDEEVDAFITEVQSKLSSNLHNVNDPSFREEICADIQQMLSTYPNNHRLLAFSIDNMVMLLWAHHQDRFTKKRPDKKAEMNRLENECIRQANVLFNHCSNMEYLDLAHRRLVSVYRIMGNYEKAEEHAKQLVDPNRFHLAVVYDEMGRTEDALTEHCRNLYAKLLQLEPILPAIGSLYRKQKKYEEAYACYRLRIELFEMILGGIDAEAAFHCNLAVNSSYAWCALTCMDLARPDEAMDWLEKWIHFERKRKENHTVVTKSNLPYFYGIDNRKAILHNYKLTPSLAWDGFAPIRDTERFKAIAADAESFEKGE